VRHARMLWAVLWTALVFSGCASEAGKTRALAEKGNPVAQYKLAQILSEGDAEDQNIEEALAWYKKAADGGNADAQAKLGHLYMAGDVVQRNYVTAAYWYRQAALQGHSDAQAEYGDLYYLGYGVPQDYGEALKFFQEAALQRHVRAQFRLAEMHAEGRGVPRDLVLAHMWANLAAAQGDRQALVLRDVLGSKMTSEQLVDAQRQAREWGETRHARQPVGTVLSP
jgi:TPR repeat protein